MDDATTTSETLCPLIVRRIAAVLDLDADDIVDDGTLPPLWHWGYFTDIAEQSNLGADGHPDRRKHGEDPNDVAAFPRRMFAGGRLEIDTPLRIGALASRRSAITQVRTKEGRRGPLRFVTVRDEITDDLGGRITEERDLVYLGAEPQRAPRDTTGEPGDVGWPHAPWAEEFTPDAVLLFRFSAVTFNGHRIHYDRAYTTGVEGYPDLVVHGPLLALRLCELGRRSAGAPISRFSFRARQPVFVGQAVALRGWPDGADAELAAYATGSEPALTATMSAG